MASFALYSSEYSLHKNNQVYQKGLLLRLENLATEQSVYSCLQSWESLGDAPWSEYLKRFYEGDFDYAPIKNALSLAFVAGEPSKWSLEKHDLKSHLLWDECFELSEDWMAKMIEYGFRATKIKIDKDLSLSLLHLQNHFLAFDSTWKLRLDFNLKFKKEEVYAAFSNLEKDFVQQIEWIEDPFEGTEKDWDEFSDQFLVRTAVDWVSWSKHVENYKNKVLVQKLSRSQDIAPLKEGHFLFTSYMAHPLEQLISQTYALKLQQKYSDIKVDGGFASHFFYDSNPYSHCLALEDGALYLKDKDLFLDLLKNENWKRHNTNFTACEDITDV